jgi:hypothetical protein
MATWTLPDALQLLHSQYPGAFVTSGQRDPNSALGRANPSSYHNVGQAFDIRPMAGVSFDNYVSNLKAAGLPVVEALDEAKHPKAWTTGPNWHIAFAQGPNAYYPGSKQQVATSPIDLVRRAQAFNVDIPSGDPTQAPTAAPAGGFDIKSLLAMLPQAMPMEQKKNVPLWAKILGVLGDTYGEVHSGRQGAFIPTLLQANQGVDDRNFAREKLNEQIASDRASLIAKLQEQPAMLQDFQAFQGMSPEQQHAFLLYKDAVSPNTVATPQGTTNVPRTQTKTIGGKTYYNVGGTWYEEGQ